MVINNFFKIVYEDKEIGEFLFRPSVPMPLHSNRIFLVNSIKKRTSINNSKLTSALFRFYN